MEDSPGAMWGLGGHRVEPRKKYEEKIDVKWWIPDRVRIPAARVRRVTDCESATAYSALC
jgi:hypothetical protein